MPRLLAVSLAMCGLGCAQPEPAPNVASAQIRDGELVVRSLVGSPVAYRLVALRRFAPEGAGAGSTLPGRWVPVPGAAGLQAGLRPNEPRRLAVAAPLPDGLYHARASADGRAECELLFAGPLCNDVHIGPPRRGFVATCVPGHGARFVPDPLADPAHSKACPREPR